MKKAVSFILSMCILLGLISGITFPTLAVEENPFQGKTLSILGDSISTYSNCSNGTAAGTTNSTIANGAIYYPRSGFDVTTDSTWWKQAADQLGMEVLVNNSWSGSCLLNTRSGTVGAYVDRCVQLHDDTGENAGQQPDVIAVFLGTNDYYTYPQTLGSFDSIRFDSLIVEADGGTTYSQPATSMEAYAIILHKIMQAYPKAEVYCFTLLPRVNSTNQPTAFNRDLAKLAEKYGARIVDLYNCGIPADTQGFYMFMGDNLHPHNAGMDAITNAFVSSLLKNSGHTTYDVTFELDDVVVMEGTSRAVPAGKPFVARLGYVGDPRLLEISIYMGSTDITADCYADGMITIPAVTDNVTVRAALADREPVNFCWELNDEKNALVSIADQNYTQNPLTMTGGSIADGKFSKVKYTLEQAIVLKHDRPWVIEWKSAGTWTDTTDGALLFAGAASSTVPDLPYLYRRHNSDFIAFGVNSGGRYCNYGVSLRENGIDGTAEHMYRLENRLSPDGSNMVYLYVDDQEIGAMNHHWIGGTDQKTTVDWLGGQDLVFTHMGTSPHTIGNCQIEYIRVYEHYQRGPLHFRWEMSGDNNALVSVSSGSYTENPLTMTSGSITDGKFSKVKFTMEQAVVLKHDQPWSIQWQSEGTWTDTTDGALLFAGAASSTTPDVPYLYRRHNSDFIAFGVCSGGRYYNYGISLRYNGIDGIAPHDYTLANRINPDGTNMVYLYVDGKEIGPMNHHWIGGTDQKTTVDWLSGQDLVFTHMCTSPHTIGNCYIGYIEVSENSHTHMYLEGICGICGGRYGDVDASGSVDHNDAIYLLLYTMFGGDQYPLNGASADIDGNGSVEQEDAVYLLLHTLFGAECYPLKSR